MTIIVTSFITRMIIDFRYFLRELRRRDDYLEEVTSKKKQQDPLYNVFFK